MKILIILSIFIVLLMGDEHHLSTVDKQRLSERIQFLLGSGFTKEEVRNYIKDDIDQYTQIKKQIIQQTQKLNRVIIETKETPDPIRPLSPIQKEQLRQQKEHVAFINKLSSETVSAIDTVMDDLVAGKYDVTRIFDKLEEMEKKNAIVIKRLANEESRLQSMLAINKEKLEQFKDNPVQRSQYELQNQQIQMYDEVSQKIKERQEYSLIEVLKSFIKGETTLSEMQTLIEEKINKLLEP
jgi:ElaB/YqjD/DUF883 family membrane-anchored ribosome-binding protein